MKPLLAGLPKSFFILGVRSMLAMEVVFVYRVWNEHLIEGPQPYIPSCIQDRPCFWNRRSCRKLPVASLLFPALAPGCFSLIEGVPVFF